MKFAYFGEGQPNSTIITRLYDYKGEIGCDVETVSLEDRRPLGAGFAINPDESFYFPVDSPLFPWTLLEDPGIPIVFHNSGFDVRVLEDYGHIKITNIQDSCIAAQLLGMPAKLGELCESLFGRPPRLITDLIGEPPNQITMDQVPVEKVAERACLDAEDALEAWQQLKGKMAPRSYDLEMRFLPVAMDIERKGIRIDKAKVSEHRQRLEREFTYLKLVCEGEGFNPGSSPQLAAVLEAKGYKVLYKKGKDGKRRPRLNKEMLTTFYNVEPFAVMTLKYRRTQSLLTHLIRPLDEGRYLTGDRIHPRMNLNVAETGRVSRSKPATQNITEELRDIIVPDEGEVIYDWDFSQIELRWAAYLWDDKVMQRFFRDGIDIHAGTANELVQAGLGSILGATPVARRRVAKDVNFAMLFGGDEETLWKRKQIPVEQGTKLLAGYFDRFPGIANGIKETRLFALRNGYTQTYYGRRRDESEKLNTGKEYLVEDALRALINNPIQGSAAETLKEAMIKDAGEPQFHTVHDAALLSVKPRYVYPNLDFQPAPFNTPRTVKVGSNWKDVKEVAV